MQYPIGIGVKDGFTAPIARLNASLAKLDKPTRDLASTFQRFNRVPGLETVSSGVMKIARAGEEAARRITSMVPGLAALTSLGLVGGIAKLTGDFAKSAVATDNMARGIGIGARELQNFRNASHRVGVTSETADASLQGLGKTIEDALTGRNFEAAASAYNLGIQLKHLSNGSVDTIGTMKQLADVIAKLPNAQAQEAVANAWGVPQMLPMLRLGSKGIDEMLGHANKFTGYLDGPGQEQGRKYNALLQDLSDSADSFSGKLGERLLPVTTRVVGGIEKLNERFGVLVANKLGDWADDAAKAFDKLIVKDGPVDKLTELLDKLNASAAPKFDVTSPVQSLDRMSDYYGMPKIPRPEEMLSFISQHLPFGPNAIWQEMIQTQIDNKRETDQLWRRSMPQSKRVSQAMGFFTSQGWSKEQAAGIVANLHAESGLDPAQAGDNGDAYGIAQWHFPRQLAFRAMMGKSLKDSTFDDQLAFVDWELKHSEKPAGDALRRASSAGEAGSIVSRMYERPAAVEEAAKNRSDLAGKVMVQIDVNAPAGTTSRSRSSGDVSTKTRVGTPSVATSGP